MKKYSIIYADPPWSYNDKAMQRGGAERHYKTMSINDICRIPVHEMTQDNAILFIWTTFPKIFETEKVIDMWGFDYKTVGFVWVKTNQREKVDQLSFLPKDSFDSFWGMGRWTRANAEICLIATKGRPKRESASVHQIIYEPIKKHSRKPNEARKRIIQLCGDLPRLELFAREKKEGFDVWGNELVNDIPLFL